MHDARSNKIEGAIQRHGVKAESARNGFVGLPQSDHDALLAFLDSL
jgi:CxxC motif-containing protein (DUF1111 family)